MNAGNFIIGLIFGYLISTKANLKKYKSNLIGCSSIVLYFLLPATFKFLYYANYIKAPIGTALLGAYMKHHDGLFLSLFLWNYVFEKQPSNFHKALYSLPVFKFLEKLFMPTFFCQLFLVKFFIANSSVLIELSWWNIVRLIHVILFFF